MRRFWLLALLAVVAFLPLGCGSSSNPTSSAKSSSSGSSFSYPFVSNFGFYYGTNYDDLYNSYCGFYFPEPGGFSDLTGVAVGNGYIFAGDDDWGDIQVFDMNGNYITFFWPYDSEGNEEMDEPEGMTVANNRLYVADSDWGYVNVFNIPEIISQAAQTQNCNYVVAYGTYYDAGDSDSDVAVDSKGNMYVSDWDFNTVYVIAPDFYTTGTDGDGNWGDDVIASTSTGVTGINSGNLNDPSGIAVDPAGQHVYVGDYDNNVVQVYSYNGGATLTSTGAIGSPTGAPSTLTGQFDGPWGIRVDNQGNLMVCDTGNARVQRLTTSGSVLNIIGSSETAAGGLYSPEYLAVDSSNNLYVTDENVATIDIYAGH